MKNDDAYTTQLQAGLGLIQETNVLIDFWDPELPAKDFYQRVLEEGVLPNISARRLRNIVAECFSSRYLKGNPAPAVYIKQLKETFSFAELKQIYFIYTCRANQILADFVRDIYWDRYQSGSGYIANHYATEFINDAMVEGKTSKRWSDGTVKRVSAYLMGACGDYGLLSPPSRSERQILPYRLESKVAVFIAHDIHFQGISDNALLQHEDWRLFGLEAADIREEFKRMSLQGHLIFQSAARINNISWNYTGMQEVVDALT